MKTASSQEGRSMGSVFRQQYTRPIPEGAQPITMKVKRKVVDADGVHIREVEVPAVRFRGEGGKWVTAPITQKGKNAGKYCRVKCHAPQRLATGSRHKG